MKKRSILMVLLFCSMLMVGCSVNSPVGYKCVGEKESIVNEESVTVLDSFIEDGKIIVKIEVDFYTVTLNDFYSINIKKSEVDYEQVNCNKNETQKYNGKDIFDTNYEGEVYLVFTDESISEKHLLKDYTMSMEYDNGNGTVKSHRFLIGE